MKPKQKATAKRSQRHHASRARKARKSSAAPRTIRRHHARAVRHSAPAPRLGVDGVNVNDLVIMTEKVKNNPSLAEYTFRASTHWLGGARARTKIQSFKGAGAGGDATKRSFIVEADEPTALLGTNHAPSPVEYALATLGSSFAEWVAYNAAARGIKLESLDIQLEGGMDLRGALGVRESQKASDGGKVLRPGFESIKIECNVKSDAPPSELKELVEYAKETCPVFDMFRHPVPIAVELKH